MGRMRSNSVFGLGARSNKGGREDLSWDPGGDLGHSLGADLRCKLWEESRIRTVGGYGQI